MGKNRGFTIIEMIISIMVILAIACLVIPKLGNHLTRSRAQEAGPILRAIYMAQMDYDRETGGTDGGYAGASQAGKLDGDPANIVPANFGSPTFADVGTIHSCGKEVGRMQSTFGSPNIILMVLSNGNIVCRPASNPCPGQCTTLGFTACCS